MNIFGVKIGAQDPYVLNYRHEPADKQGAFNYRQDEDRHILQLFIDQAGAGGPAASSAGNREPEVEMPLRPPSGFKESTRQRAEELTKSAARHCIAGAQIDYEVSRNIKTGATTRFFKLSLEPAKNVDDTVQLLKDSGFDSRLFGHKLAVPARRSRMHARGLAISTLSEEKTAHYAALVTPYSNEAGEGNCAILDRLLAKGFLTPYSVQALKAGMEAVESAAAREEFPERALKKTLKTLLDKSRDVSDRAR